MMSLAIVSTHPIQYDVPIFRLLAKQSDLRVKVYYDHIPDAETQGRDFGRPFQWDIDLLSGYDYVVGRAGGKELREKLEAREYSALLLKGWHHPFLIKMGLTACMTGTPLVVRGDSHLKTPRSRLREWIKKPLYERMFSYVNGCLAVGSWNAEYFRFYGVPPSKIFFSPHSIDREWFAQKAAKIRPQRSDLRKKWGFHDDDFIFSYFGKLIEIKRPQDFVKAVLIANSQNSYVKGLVVGDGILRRSLEQSVGDSGMPVKFTGFLNQTEIIEAYVASDCLVLPGKETWGLVVNEGMACGLPAIVSDEAGCGVDMIVSGKNGLIFECENPDHLAQSMLRWTGCATSRNQIEIENDIILQKYSCEQSVRGMVDALKVIDHV